MVRSTARVSFAEAAERALVGESERTTLAPVRRARWRWWALLLPVAAVTSACSSGPPTPSAFAGKSASQILQVALHNAIRAGSLHYSVKTTGSAQQTVDGASGSQGGFEVVTSAEGEVHIEVIGTTGYIASPAEGLVATMGMTQSVAAANAGRWISMKSTDQPFSQLSQAVSFRSIIDEFTPDGPLHLVFTQIGGRTVGLVVGTGTASQAVKSYHVELAISASEPLLPVGGVLQITANGHTVTQTGVFAQWGKPIGLQVPPGPVPWDSLVPQ